MIQRHREHVFLVMFGDLVKGPQRTHVVRQEVSFSWGKVALLGFCWRNGTICCRYFRILRIRAKRLAWTCWENVCEMKKQPQLGSVLGNKERVHTMVTVEVETETLPPGLMLGVRTFKQVWRKWWLMGERRWLFSFGTITTTQFIRSFLGFFFQLSRKDVGHISETAKFSLNISAGCKLWHLSWVWLLSDWENVA